MRKGFTLVELSIVLVIIGLLAGGILVAQSMISTVRIQMLVRQIQQVDIAVTNHKTKFGYLPGDAPFDSYAAPGWAVGDGNGQISMAESTAFGPVLINDGYSGPFYNPWPAEQPWQILTLNYGASSNSGAEVSKVPPQIMPIYMPGMHYTNYYIVGAVNAGCCATAYPDVLSGEWSTFPTYTPSEALAIDQKIDDGLTGAVTGTPTNQSTYGGIVLAQGYKGGYGPDPADPTEYFLNNAQSCMNPSNLSQYNTSYTSPACSLWIAVAPGVQ